jgi:lauroyl/myristoyl acyltransferase
LEWSDATARKIRYRLEWLALKSATKIVPLLSRKARYRLALLLSSLRTSLDRQRRRVALSNLRVVFGDEISPKSQVVRLFQADATFTMSSLLLGFGVCVGLLLSAFH